MFHLLARVLAETRVGKGFGQGHSRSQGLRSIAALCIYIALLGIVYSIEIKTPFWTVVGAVSLYCAIPLALGVIVGRWWVVAAPLAWLVWAAVLTREDASVPPEWAWLVIGVSMGFAGFGVFAADVYARRHLDGSGES